MSTSLWFIVNQNQSNFQLENYNLTHGQSSEPIQTQSGYICWADLEGFWGFNLIPKFLKKNNTLTWPPTRRLGSWISELPFPMALVLKFPLGECSGHSYRGVPRWSVSQRSFSKIVYEPHLIWLAKSVGKCASLSHTDLVLLLVWQLRAAGFLSNH